MKRKWQYYERGEWALREALAKVWVFVCFD